MNIGFIQWGSLNHMWYAPLFIGAGMIALYRFWRWRSCVRMLATSTYHKKLIINDSVPRQLVKTVLLCCALVFLFLALLQPQWQKKEVTVAQEGRDLFVALDISRSMLAQDCKPNRLACAKQKIKTLLQQLSCERVGLILFSGATFVQCPLTADYGSLLMFLDQIDAETISSGTTSLSQAIQQALNSFKTTQSRKHKLLVMFTDGEDFSSNLSGVKQEAKKAGLTIFTLGVGSADGAPIPLFDIHGKAIGHQLDSKDSIVISRRNDGILRTVAQDCGGTYIPMTEDSSDINTLVQRVQCFEKEKLGDKKICLFDEHYNYFVAVSFGCLLIEWLL